MTNSSLPETNPVPERSPDSDQPPAMEREVIEDNTPLKMSEHPYLKATLTNHEVSPDQDIKITPACLKNSGREVIILDPGHDDSKASTRSDAKVRGGSSRYVILWPKVHEGKLNMVTAWLVYDLILKNPALSEAQKKELQTMIRFTRLPGERKFGEYEREEGYYNSTQGNITSGVTNRRNRANFMMKHHKRFSAKSAKNLSNSFTSIKDKSVFISIHANSSSFYDEGDHIWLIPPKALSSSNVTKKFVNTLRKAFSIEMSDYMRDQSADERSIQSFKNSLLPTVKESKIRINQHPTNLAMLSSSLGTSKTIRVLTEGFVMNGKAGHIAKNEIDSDTERRLIFERDSQEVARYDYSSLYLAYAKSIARGISDHFNCSN